MIFSNKRFIYRMVMIAIYYFFIMFLTLWFDYADWWKGFSDKFFVYQFTIVFLIGNMYVNECYHSYTISRLGSRKKAVFSQMADDFIYTIMSVSILFVSFMLLNVLIKGRGYVESTGFLMDYYFRYLLTAFLLTNVARLFAHANMNMNMLKKCPQLFAFFILLLDILILCPTVHRELHLEINIFFSWMFSERKVVCYMMLILWNVLTIWYLCRKCNQEDIM